jgi:phospholipid/cholesterol/gamma-HCH transport system substrate-binding protein
MVPSMSRTLTRLQAVILGLLVLVGLGLGASGLFAIGKRQWLWSETFHVRTGFKQVSGVEPGTRVRVQGIEAGEVESVQSPDAPGGDVVLRLRLDGRLRTLVREDACVRIVSEGLIGGKVVEINPGSNAARQIEEDAFLASKPTADLSEVLSQVNAALGELKEGQGTVSKFIKDPDAYANLVVALQKSQDTMATIQQDAEAIRRLPVIRSYVEDPTLLLVRPDCERYRKCYAQAELFESERSILTQEGRNRLDELAPWFAGLKQKGSEVVVVSYADAKTTSPTVARTLTQQQSESVCKYLRDRFAVQKIGWFARRKVTPLGLGTSSPPIRDTEELPASRTEVLVYVPQR